MVLSNSTAGHWTKPSPPFCACKQKHIQIYWYASQCVHACTLILILCLCMHGETQIDIDTSKNVRICVLFFAHVVYALELVHIPRALYFYKRALSFRKRALYFRKNYYCISAKEPCIFSWMSMFVGRRSACWSAHTAKPHKHRHSCENARLFRRNTVILFAEI